MDVKFRDWWGWKHDVLIENHVVGSGSHNRSLKEKYDYPINVQSVPSGSMIARTSRQFLWILGSKMASRNGYRIIHSDIFIKTFHL